MSTASRTSLGEESAEALVRVLSLALLGEVAIRLYSWRWRLVICLPALVGRLGAGNELRVWVAACATGEEAYSLAILAREALDGLDRPPAVKIFATDAHRASLDTAGAGVYSEAAVAGISPERLARFFVPVGGGFQVSAELRKMVVFAQHNVLKDAPFTRLDLVCCRNLLIYFQPVAQKRVLSLFHFGLKTGGALFLGPSETTGEVGDEFEPVDPQWRVYRKRRDVRLVADLRPPSNSPPRPGPAPGLPAPPPHPDAHLANVYDSLLDQFMPAALLVSERGGLVQAFGGASKYLKLRDGRVTTDLLEIVDPELRTALTGALPRAFKELAEVAYRGLRVYPPEGERVVNVIVHPDLYERERVTVTRGKFLKVAGRLQNTDSVVHVKAEKIEVLQTEPLAIRSHDFH